VCARVCGVCVCVCSVCACVRARAFFFFKCIPLFSVRKNEADVP